MSFIRRLLGRSDDDSPRAGTPSAAEPAEPAEPAELERLEREHELAVLRADAARLDDLQQRQLRYADYAWQPPAQGTEKRAEDGDPERT